MLKRNIEEIDFGNSAAELESALQDYFYENYSFKKACEPNICLILGEKGMGKSAIFKMMDTFSQEIPSFKNPNYFIPIQVSLKEHYQILNSLVNKDYPKTLLWKFYFASIIATKLQHESNEHSKYFDDFIKHWQINPERFPGFLNNLKYKAPIPKVGGEIEYSKSSNIYFNPIQFDKVFDIANNILRNDSKYFWIVIDKLDEIILNGNGSLVMLLGDLMRIHSEIYKFTNIRFKFFIRSDIYEDITYVNKDHFSNMILKLEWTVEDLAIMLAHRILKTDGQASQSIKFQSAIDIINDMFEWDSNNISDFDKLVDFLRDGRGIVSPRDLLTMVIKARELQIDSNGKGINIPLNGKLISKKCLQISLVKVSEAKLNDFLTIVPEISQRFKYLQGHESYELNKEQLSKLLNIPDILDLDTALSDLTRVGALGKIGNKPVHLTDKFFVPTIYRKALKIGETNNG